MITHLRRKEELQSTLLEIKLNQERHVVAHIEGDRLC